MPELSTLITATTQFNRYTSIPILVLGLIGNTFNILVFTRRPLFKNPCALYLFSATLMNMNILFFGLFIRSLMDGFHIDLIGNNLFLCRLRYLILHSSYTLSSWFLLLAGIDRFWISSRSVRSRNFSNLIIARRIVIIMTIVCLLFYIHIIGFFEIEQLKFGPYCYAKAGFYRVFYDIMFSSLFSFLPPILMIIIGLATIRNIRLVRIRIVVMNITITQLHRKDCQLIKMLFIQLIVTIFCTLPHSLQKLYITFTMTSTKTSYQSAIETLMTQITRELLYINASMSFYLYITATSGVFRHEFIEIIKRMIKFIFNNNSCIRHINF